MAYYNKRSCFFWLIVFFISFLFSSGNSQKIKNDQLAFPGAEGFGKFTTGGRGGKVFLVTNLNDDGPGSLRRAIDEDGARIVVFKTSGTIILKSPLVIKNSNITIAGQTAPGDGICIRDYPLIIEADNIIIRYIRVRLGDVNKLAEDACSAYFRKDLIIDHCSFSWGIDEVLTIRDNENSTVQWCIISESLNDSYHPKGEHGYGGIWGGMGASFHHNLIAHHSSRTPRFNGSRYNKAPEQEIVDFRNNVIYNWGSNGAYGGENGKHNLVANYYKYGPATKHKNRIVEIWENNGLWFIEDNFIFGYPEIGENNWAGGVHGKHSIACKSDEPISYIAIESQDAQTAFELVMENAGAIFPKRDIVDSRIIEETRKGIAHFGGDVFSDPNGIIDSQDEVGGWPELKSAPVLKDNDKDGMPDDWELKYGLNPENPDDRNEDKNQDGYTNIENYINGLLPIPNVKTSSDSN
jgi:hypothetical protein